MRLSRGYYTCTMLLQGVPFILYHESTTSDDTVIVLSEVRLLAGDILTHTATDTRVPTLACVQSIQTEYGGRTSRTTEFVDEN